MCSSLGITEAFYILFGCLINLTNKFLYLGHILKLAELQELEVEVDNDVVEELLDLEAGIVLVGDRDDAGALRRELTVLGHLGVGVRLLVPNHRQVHPTHLE